MFVLKVIKAREAQKVMNTLISNETVLSSGETKKMAVAN